VSLAGCVYCGLPRARVRNSRRELLRLPSCVAHADLLAVDPAYDLAGHLVAVSYPALSLSDRAPAPKAQA
jgi:hypothetical protein